MPPNKMEVNSAIDRLITAEGSEDLSDAAVIIEFMRDVKSSSKFSMESGSTKTNPSGKIVGNTEFGNIPYSTNTTESKTNSVGIHKVRVGYYKLWIYHMKSGPRINFQHFWKSEIETQGGDAAGPPKYEIGCNNDFEAIYVSQHELVVTRRFQILNLRFGSWVRRIELEVISQI